MATCWGLGKPPPKSSTPIYVVIEVKTILNHGHVLSPSSILFINACKLQAGMLVLLLTYVNT